MIVPCNKLTCASPSRLKHESLVMFSGECAYTASIELGGLTLQPEAKFDYICMIFTVSLNLMTKE